MDYLDIGRYRRESEIMNSKSRSQKYGSFAHMAEVMLKLASTRDKKVLFKLIIKHTQELVKGAGCSILMVNPKTDKLGIVESSNIPENERPKATYSKGEGKTGWVFKYGKFLYIRDENDADELKRNGAEPVHPAGPKSGKPCETKDPEVGPFMAAPIKAEGFVVGVIRTPALPGKKRFTKREQQMFAIFADRLSEVIQATNLTEKQNKLIHTFAKIGKATDIHQLLEEIVEDIPDIVGGGGCSIFLFDGERDDLGRKKFMLKASTSIDEKFKALITQRYHYLEGSIGLTAWVATTGNPLRVVDINDANELLTKQNRSDPPLIHQKSHCEIEDVGPFCAAPIRDGTEVVGVVRIPRRKGSKPFEDIDEELLSAFADQLSLTIENINRKRMIDDIRGRRKNEFEGLFSAPLITKCRAIGRVDYAKEIREFLKFPTQDIGIRTAILNMLEVLWCDKYGQKYNFPLLRDFRSYEKMLLELPGYRDHFIHQFQVFLLGAVLIDDLYVLSEEKGTKNFSDYYREALGIKKKDSEVADIAWLIASTFHDVAYPIQRSDDLYNRFFDSFMGIGGTVVDRIGLERVVSKRRYGKLIDQLCDFYFSLNNRRVPWKYNSKEQTMICVDDDFRAAFQQTLLEVKDHGVLGALVLLHQSRAGGEEYSTVIYPAALAIALHKDMLFEIHEDLRFEYNPLAFLLRYCDLVQEWGRKDAGTTGILEPEIPRLLDIKTYLGDDLKVHIATTVDLASLRIAEEKSITVGKTLGRLKSRDFVFEFAIEDTDARLTTKSY